MDTTIQETDSGKIEYLTDEKTISSGDFVIVTTPTGLYQIDVRNTSGGGKPAITEDKFTSLHHAKMAIQAYVAENAPIIRKRQIMAAGIAKRQAKANVEG